MSAINDTKNENQIIYIPIEKLHPHEDNPRKDLGDLTELADSIKKSGILQNLTVIPATGYYHGDYTVIIGHRRMAAAKLAGLTEVPCVVTEMDYKEQIATMLLENMQRSDLTIYEQAQGFQMMLNLGETVEDVSEKTGFSESTVRRRVKLLKLDADKFKASQARQVSFMEYEKLFEIEDEERRNKLLDIIGTNNFNNELQKAINEEELQKYLNEVETNLSKFATETTDGRDCSWVTDYGNWNKKEVVVPDDTDTVQYFYKKNDRYITLYKKKEEIPVDEEAERIRAEEEADKERRKEGLNESRKRAFELRQDAINCISNSHAQKYLAEIVIFIMKMTKEFYVRVDDDDVFKILDIDVESEEFEDWDDEKLDTYILNLIETRSKEKTAKMLLKFAYSISGDTTQNGYNDGWNAKYRENHRLDMIYDFLCSLGYEMSDEEKALQNGTHELFITEE